jgi:hypothetical protein
MKFARSRRRALCAFAGLAAAYAGPALAYDDKSTIGSVMELVGISSDPDAKSIDYSERPKLVLPPNRGVLPEPAARGVRPAGWPAEASSERSRNDNRYARVPNAPPDEPRKGLLERIRGPRDKAPAPGTEDEPGLLQRALMSGRGSNQPVMDEPARRMLVEPPSGYRRPTQDLSKVNDTDAKKSSWWNPLSWSGGNGNDGDPVAQPGARTPAQQARGGGSGGFSSMLPSFLRGSDSN